MTVDASKPARILLADDQEDILSSLRLLLRGEAFDIDVATSPREVVERIEEKEFDVVLMDLNYTRDTTSGREGLELLDRIRQIDPTVPVVVMTAWGTIDLAVAAMNRGARDFIEKPWENERLLSILRTQAELRRALEKGRRLEARNRLFSDELGTTFIAEDPAMEAVQQLVERVGPSDAAILITGENGTGKSLLARLLHAASSRADGPLISVNSGAIPEAVFESELFGHVRGAFTDAKADRIGRFELAHGGTIFLDEIANLPLAQQPKLLRVLETGELERIGDSRTRRVDVRILSATNADVNQEVAEGRLRQDLLYRLRTVEIHLPALRERPVDIPLLAYHFLAREARRYRKKIEGFAADAQRALRSHSWPGNVRELAHAVERATLMAEGGVIAAADLGLEESAARAPVARRDLNLEAAQRELVEEALIRHRGNMSLAAHALGISRSTLYRRIESYNLSIESDSEA